MGGNDKGATHQFISHLFNPESGCPVGHVKQRTALVSSPHNSDTLCVTMLSSRSHLI